MINPAWAQAASGGAPPALMQFMPLVLIFVVFYFLLIRPQQQKAKEHKTMLSNLKRNDDIITSGGLFGKVMALTDKVVTLEIAPNVRVRVDRQQIASVAKSGPPEDGKENKDKEKDKAK
jgi:preprotein translocase subunit YajC